MLLFLDRDITEAVNTKHPEERGNALPDPFVAVTIGQTTAMMG